MVNPAGYLRIISGIMDGVTSTSLPVPEDPLGDKFIFQDDYPFEVIP